MDGQIRELERASLLGDENAADRAFAHRLRMDPELAKAERLIREALSREQFLIKSSTEKTDRCALVVTALPNELVAFSFEGWPRVLVYTPDPRHVFAIARGACRRVSPHHRIFNDDPFRLVEAVETVLRARAQ